MKKFNDLLTICLVSFHSDTIIKKILKIIPLKYKVIITNNAVSKNLKVKLENSFKNVKVITPSHNLGNGGGVNYALKKTITSIFYRVGLHRWLYWVNVWIMMSIG